MASFIIEDVKIYTGETVIDKGSVAVQDGIITYVGHDLPRLNDPAISAPGATLMPGLIDAHIHADKGRIQALEQSIRFGVTTVIDLFNEPNHVASLKKAVKARHDVADFKTSCYAATVDGGWPAAVVLKFDKSEEVRLVLSNIHVGT